MYLTMLQKGGNAKLEKYFANNDVPKDTPILFKYNTKSAKQYREELLSIVSNVNRNDTDE